MKKFFCFLLTTFFVIGCENSIDSINSYDYSIEQRRDCFCPRAGVWVRLFVKSDTIASAIYVENNSPLSYEEKQSYRTIKGLFDEISSIDTSFWNVEIIMDSVNNYPSYIYFSPKPIIQGDTIGIYADALFKYTTRNYIKLN